VILVRCKSALSVGQIQSDGTPAAHPSSRSRGAGSIAATSSAPDVR